ncbi:MAG: DEAD/DEAH box helicase [Selenomonadaceae bacterium]|nr:DEAD/DEAH box helicase [Selenomonadaceae bacterium]
MSTLKFNILIYEEGCLMTFEDVLKKYRTLPANKLKMSMHFEKMMKRFMQTYPVYLDKFSDVWIWQDFPYNQDFSDIVNSGIDLVAKTHSGEFWAIHCRSYPTNSNFEKYMIELFTTMSNRTFNVDGEIKTFSQRLWISTNDIWSEKLNKELREEIPSIAQIDFTEMQTSPINWYQLYRGTAGRSALNNQRNILPHQIQAVDAAHEYFKTKDRGKLIMPCGTGKTFTSLKIAENEIGDDGVVLFLVPSTTMLKQALFEWATFSENPVNAICVCSDPKNLKFGDDEIVNTAIPLPTITDVDNLIQQINSEFKLKRSSLNVIFATYQYVDVISEAQKQFNFEFDLIVIDEAHRTTEFVEQDGADNFFRIHDNNFIKAKRRLYMTATPKLYKTEIQNDTNEQDLTIWSMDNETIFGADIYVLKFSEAVAKGLISDYRIMVMAVSEEQITPQLQQVIYDSNEKFTNEEVCKLIGCIHAMSKNVTIESEDLLKDDPHFMHRAVAFCATTNHSLHICSFFNKYKNVYYDNLSSVEKYNFVKIQLNHIDGSKIYTTTRKNRMDWLESKSINKGECNILLNACCFAEEADMPNLDAVIFLSQRKFYSDIVRAVGRVMRKSADKKYGYIVIPLVLPINFSGNEAFSNSKDYDMFWQILNVLRAHDDEFYDEINKLEFNPLVNENKFIITAPPSISQTRLNFNDLHNAITGQIIENVGDRFHWKILGNKFADVIEDKRNQIKELVSQAGEQQSIFNNFVNNLHKIINPRLNKNDALDIIEQHLVSLPVIEALNKNFIDSNGVSKYIQKMLSLFINDEKSETFYGIYKSVVERCENTTSAMELNDIIVELYDKFIKFASTKTTDKTGVIDTPLEIVDFVLQSVNDILKREFDCSLSTSDVKILDPFSGTGIFLARLIQSDIISDEELNYKYKNDFFANDINLLSYYLSCINIENAYNKRSNSEDYLLFDNVCLTDTLQLNENVKLDAIDNEVFARNYNQMQNQKNTNIQVIIGNPPNQVNNNIPNQIYKHLDNRINHTYNAKKNNTNQNKLYDSYIRAFRWASDRIDENGGIIGFVTSADWLKDKTMNGLRKCFEDEFTSIYIFNLRVNQRTIYEFSTSEYKKFSDNGTPESMAITILVKNPRATNASKANIYYRDIGHYLKYDEKMETIAEIKSCLSNNFNAVQIIPDEQHNWIVQNTDTFNHMIAIEPDNNFDVSTESVFSISSCGLNNKFNFSQDNINAGLDKITIGVCKPFNKQFTYIDDTLIADSDNLKKFFPRKDKNNLVICVSGVGNINPFGTLIVNQMPCLDLMENLHCLPLYYYELSTEQDLFGDNLIQQDGISDYILNEASQLYKEPVNKEDIFYYVYGFLHIRTYRNTFAAELKNSLPRIFLVSEYSVFARISKAGRELAELHLNYENQEAPFDTIVEGLEHNNFYVQKMQLSDKRDSIIYNENIRINNIPQRVYAYTINGRSLIEWIIENYQIKTDKLSGLVNNPNDWLKNQNNPRYIIDLILSSIAVSLKTLDIIESLPDLNFDD